MDCDSSPNRPTSTPTWKGPGSRWRSNSRKPERSSAIAGLHALKDQPGQVEIGFTLASEYQGKGYATEAVSGLLDYVFRGLCKHRVTAITDARNAAAARVLEKVGMRREGHFIQNVWFKGAWGDEYLYALLGHEWRGS